MKIQNQKISNGVLILSLFFAILTLATPILVSAQGEGTCPEGYVCIDNPLTQSSIAGIICAIIGLLKTIALPIAILIIVWGGIQIMVGTTTGEKESKVIQGKKTITYAVIGYAIIFLVDFIVGFVAEILGGPGSNICQ